MPKHPHLKETFRGKRVVIDNKSFVECIFIDCTLVYRGGTPPDMIDCELSSLHVDFEQGAANTISLLRAMYYGYGDTGQKLIEDLIAEIRRPEAG